MHRTIAALGMLLAALAPAAAAQNVHGLLHDDDRNRPLPGFRLYLLSDSGTAVDSTTTDRAGAFLLHAPAAGEYVVYLRMDGWTSVASEPLRLETGATRAFEFRVSLVSNSAFRQMNEMIATDPRLQSRLPEACGEALRPWEAGLLVGVVRERAGRSPIAGARVAVLSADGTVVRSTISSDEGIYLLCNVPLGAAVEIAAETPDGRTRTTQVEIRAGTVSWYDLFFRTREQ